LSAVAFLSILGQILVQYEIGNQQSDSRIINLAGRQRYQSQQIVKSVLILTDTNRQFSHPEVYLRDVEAVFAIWQNYHEQLRSGKLKELGLTVKNSAQIIEKFNELDPPFLVIRDHVRRILNYVKNPPSGEKASVQESVRTILDHEMRFLRKMDEIVYQYDQEAREKLDTLRRIELSLLGLALFVLLLEGVFVFRPAVRQLKRAILHLVESELRSKEANAELVAANQSLKKAEEELLAITRQQHQQEINEQKLRAAYVIEGQEEERRRLAREIHDGLGQMLTALKLNIEKMSGIGAFSDQAQQSITHLQGLISQTISEARTISFNLMPAVLSDFGIASALKLLAEQNTRSTNTEIIFHSEWNEDRLDKNTEIGLYRIAQEGMNNAIKYAQASEITLKLSSKQGHVHLHILDNGQGFRRTKLAKASLSHGINHMKVRSHLLDGHFRMVASPGKGTRIYVKIPLRYR
jgi:signal transduction histidine kinase